MDSDIEELKDEVEKLKAISMDTNRTVHKMRRSVWWGRIFQISWWLIVLAISGAAYYYYLQPYVAQFEQAYAGFQHGAQQAQGFQEQVQGLINKYFGSNSSTTPQ